jgi:hypothetical protein
MGPAAPPDFAVAWVVAGCCQPASLLRIDPPGPHFANRGSIALDNDSASSGVTEHRCASYAGSAASGR